MKHFAGNLLDGFSWGMEPDRDPFDKERAFLINFIQKLESKPIRVTRLLLRYDRHVEVKDFHQFIDCQPHWAIIMKLSNSSIVAGYSRGPLRPGVDNREAGFLSSLSNEQCFYFDGDNHPKLTSYYKPFLAFGSL